MEKTQENKEEEIDLYTYPSQLPLHMSGNKTLQKKQKHIFSFLKKISLYTLRHSKKAQTRLLVPIFA